MKKHFNEVHATLGGTIVSNKLLHPARTLKQSTEKLSESVLDQESVAQSILR